MNSSSLRRIALGLAMLLAAFRQDTTATTVLTDPAQAAKSDSRAQSLSSSVGLNKFDLFRQYLRKSGDAKDVSYQKVSQSLARKAMLDAHNIGVTYFRVGITGIAPQSFDSP